VSAKDQNIWGIRVRLGEFGDSEALAVARRFLDDPNTRVASDHPTHTTATELLKVWEVRVRNTQITGRTLRGAKAFVQRLIALPPGTEVVLYSLQSPELVGLFFFEVHADTFVGLVLVERPDQRLENWNLAMGKTGV